MDAESRPPVMKIELRAPNLDALSDLAKKLPFLTDAEVPRRTPGGTFRVRTYVSSDLLGEIERTGAVFEVIENATEAGKVLQQQIGRGDRFAGGKIVPRGLGKKEG